MPVYLSERNFPPCPHLFTPARLLILLKNYNTKLDKYLLLFEDESEDLIKEEDINGVDMYFADKGKRAKRVNYSALEKGRY